MSSRIQKSIANAKVNIIFYMLTAFLAFFSRKVFLDNLGTEFLGLSGTLGDILNLMNITELGIGTAVGVTLYKPIHDNCQEKIRDLISVFGYLYFRIGIIIASVSIALSCFFPLIFKNVNMPLWLVFFMFFSMVYSSLLGYFINYRQIILSASQQNYVIRLRYDTLNIIKILLQIGSSYLPYNYIWWILIETITITISSVVVNNVLRKRYPWLVTSVKAGKSKFKQYKDLWLKTKQVFVFKLSHIIFTGSINILIGIFASLSMVTMFSNYNILMNKTVSFFDGLFTGMAPSIGNLIADQDKGTVTKIFYELLSIRYFVAGFCSITLYFTVPNLIVVWIGEEYILSQAILILMSIHVFIIQSRLTVTNFKDAYGLFQDTWAPVAEVVISIGLSLILGHRFGIVGILFAFVVANFLIKLMWQPYYLCKNGLKISYIKNYLPVFCKYILLLSLSMLVTYYVQEGMTHYMMNTQTTTHLIVYCAGVAVIVLCMLLMTFFCFDTHFRRFIKHMMAYRSGNRV